MKKNVYFNVMAILFTLIIFQNAQAEKTLYINITDPTPISDRTIPMNATTNPIAFTVSDSDGGPLEVICSSSNQNLVPNKDSNIIIENTGKRIIVDAKKNEKKHLTARVIPLFDQSGVTTLTFKVIDPCGLFAIKSMDLTVTTKNIAQELDVDASEYALVQSSSSERLNKILFSLETQHLIKLSPSGSGAIRVNNKTFKRPVQAVITQGESLQVEAIPTQDWKFVYWAGDKVDTENPLNIVAQNNLDIQAIFVSQDQQENFEEQNWNLRLWISDNEKPDIVLSEIRIGVSSFENKEVISNPNPLLYVISGEDETTYSYHFISDKNEQFRNILITAQSGKLNWAFENETSGEFKLIDELTNNEVVSDMKEISEWHIPHGNTVKHLLLHYIP